MARSKAFLRTRDIDWAFASRGYYIHVSSAGGDLPKDIEDSLFDVWYELKNAEIVCLPHDIKWNEQYLEMKFSKMAEQNPQDIVFRMNWYTHSFIAMAMRGFYTFDRDISTPFEASEYHWIAQPVKMFREPHLHLPEVALDIVDPEELEGKDIVTFFNKAKIESQQNSIVCR